MRIHILLRSIETLRLYHHLLFIQQVSALSQHEQLNMDIWIDQKQDPTRKSCVLFAVNTKPCVAELIQMHPPAC